MRKKICIICKKHGEFWQIPNDHLRGFKCRKCDVEQNAANRSNKQVFIKKALLVHGDKFDYSKIEYINSASKIDIICKVHGSFEQTPNSHLQGIGCPKCGAELIKLKLSDSTEKFIEKAKLIKNNNIKYNYLKVNYINNKKKVIIICNEHGEFNQTPNSHLRGDGCPICGDKYRPLKSNTIDFIKKCNKVHDNKYCYDKVEYNGCFKKILIICRVHGEFYQQAWSHVTGQGCPKCSSKTKTKEEYILEANQIHHNKYNYDQINYQNMTDKITIICNKHGKFKKRPLEHLKGSGCPRCSKAISKPETDWLDYLNIKYRNISVILNNSYIKPDGYDPETNTIYEFYGDYWHGNPAVYHPNDINVVNKKSFKELYDRTIQREVDIKKFGYKIISIWESDWNKLKNEINRAFKPDQRNSK